VLSRIFSDFFNLNFLTAGLLHPKITGRDQMRELSRDLMPG
jgi:hypothetical protein